MSEQDTDEMTMAERAQLIADGEAEPEDVFGFASIDRRENDENDEDEGGED